MGYRGAQQEALAASRVDAAVDVCAAKLPALIARRQARIWAFGPAALAGACVLGPALCRITWTEQRFAPTFEDPAFGLAAAVMFGIVAWLALRVALDVAQGKRFAARVHHARTLGRTADFLRAELARGEALGRAAVVIPLLAAAVLGPHGLFAVPAAIFGASLEYSGWILQGGVAALVAHLVLCVSAMRQGRRRSATTFGASLPVAMLAAALVVVPGIVFFQGSPFGAMVAGLATATAVGVHGLLGWPLWLSIMDVAIARDAAALAACHAACDAIELPVRIEDLAPGAVSAAAPIRIDVPDVPDQPDELEHHRARRSA